LSEHGAAAKPAARRSQRGFQYEGWVAIAGLAAAWQIASYFFPSFLFPPVPAIAERFVEIFTSVDTTLDALATAGRILAGLAGAFVLGGMLAAAMARFSLFERYAHPILSFNQGVPALSWVVIAIIWFKGIEFRIFFIMVMTTLPAFTFQVLDAYRSLSNDLYEMTLAFRPSRYDLLRTLIWPAVLPGVLTAWKVNLGNASRVVVVAELVGATGGVGYQLLLQQQVFDMAGAIAWTIVLVIFVLIVQYLITLVETRALKYRAVSERSL
jgi:NitT/TauT family transport system permease protein